MDPQKILTLILSTFALLGIIVGIIVYLKQSVADGTIASLERSNAAFETELKAQKLQFEGELVAKDRTIKDQELRISALELKGVEQDRTIEILKGVVTNTDEVHAIASRLDEHHIAAMHRLDLMSEHAIEEMTILSRIEEAVSSG